VRGFCGFWKMLGAACSCVVCIGGGVNGRGAMDTTVAMPSEEFCGLGEALTLWRLPASSPTECPSAELFGLATPAEVSLALDGSDWTSLWGITA
jgi:hypothetical protein